MQIKNHIIKFIVPIIAVLAAFLVGAVIIAAVGGNPILSYSYLFHGAFGSASNVGTTFVKATPLIFTGLAATFAYKCGVFNLGAEGQFVMGAIASLVVSSHLSGLPSGLVIVISLLAAAVAGGFWGFIPGILKNLRGLNEMIVSIMLNYIAVLFMGYLYSGPLREGSVPQTAAVKTLLIHIPGTRVHIGIILAVVLAIVMYYFMFYTAAGFKLRAVGMNETASHFNGFFVTRTMLLSFVISGAIAGIGGGVELHGTQYRLMAGFGNGYGFDGVAIALIGQLNPIGTVLVAYLFAILRTGATAMQVGTGIPTSVIDIIQALVIIFAVGGSAYVNLPSVRQFLSNTLQGKKKEEVTN